MTLPLENPTASVGPNTDKRTTLPEPSPARLLVIDDVWLDTPTGKEAELDSFYVGLLRFVRDDNDFAYKAERFRLGFRVVDAPQPREDYRPTMIQVPHWTDVRNHLEVNGVPYEHQKGLTPGGDILLLRDPAGNFVSVGMIVEVR